MCVSKLSGKMKTARSEIMRCPSSSGKEIKGHYLFLRLLFKLKLPTRSLIYFWLLFGTPVAIVIFVLKYLIAIILINTILWRFHVSVPFFSPRSCRSLERPTSTNNTTYIACKRRRICGCGFFGGDKRQPEMRLRSQVTAYTEYQENDKYRCKALSQPGFRQFC